MKRIAVSLVLAALVACRTDQMLPAPSALIRDAGHNGGNFFFAFLQPMVSQPTRNGVFDATQSPTVKVALLSGDASCTDPHLTYTMSTGPGGDASETVRVNATGGNYIVNLHTDKVAVTSGCTYRIRVVIGLIELGFADIQLFLTQGAAKNLTDNETVGLVDGKTLPIKFWIAQGVLRDVGQGTASPDHETVIVTQNLKAGVLIPAGAVSVPTTILIESVDDRPCFPGLVGQSFEGLPGATENSCYRFRTDPPLPNGRFNTPVVVGICVDLSQVTEAQKPKIQIFQFDAADLRLPDRIKALPDAPAPFLPCDPAYPGGIGLGKPGILDFAAHLFTSLFSPKPAFARSRPVVFDLGAGGSTDGFSLFTWGLVTDMTKNAGDLQTAAVGTAVATPPSVIFTDSTGALVDSVPVTFTAGSGSGTVTVGSTKSGRGGVSGVAQVGSWTLGSAGPNTLIASAPAFSSVTPTSLTFTATGVTSLVGYEVVTSGVITLGASGGFDRQTAVCPVGKKVLAGGAQVVGAGAADFNTRLQESAPGTINGGAQDLWLVSMKNLDASPHNVQIFAVCATPPTGYSVVSSTDVSLGPGVFNRQSVVCPAGKNVLGGGVAVVGEGTADFNTRVQESGPATVNGGAQDVWVASIKNADATSHTVEISAICVFPLSGYQVIVSSNISLAGGGGFDTRSVLCPVGKSIVGGGAQVIGEGSADFNTRLQESTPGTIGGGAQDVWAASLKNEDGSAHTMAIRAVCANATGP
jgi:hypothetical protein